MLRYFKTTPSKYIQEAQIIDNNGKSLNTKLNNITQHIVEATADIDTKQNKIAGKSLSLNDFTNFYKNKLSGNKEGVEFYVDLIEETLVIIL